MDDLSPSLLTPPTSLSSSLPQKLPHTTDQSVQTWITAIPYSSTAQQHHGAPSPLCIRQSDPIITRPKSVIVFSGTKPSQKIREVDKEVKMEVDVALNDDVGSVDSTAPSSPYSPDSFSTVSSSSLPSSLSSSSNSNSPSSPDTDSSSGMAHTPGWALVPGPSGLIKDDRSASVDATTSDDTTSNDDQHEPRAANLNLPSVDEQQQRPPSPIDIENDESEDSDVEFVGDFGPTPPGTVRPRPPEFDDNARDGVLAEDENGDDDDDDCLIVFEKSIKRPRLGRRRQMNESIEIVAPSNDVPLVVPNDDNNDDNPTVDEPAAGAAAPAPVGGGDVQIEANGVGILWRNEDQALFINVPQPVEEERDQVEHVDAQVQVVDGQDQVIDDQEVQDRVVEGQDQVVEGQDQVIDGQDQVAEGHGQERVHRHRRRRHEYLEAEILEAIVDTLPGAFRRNPQRPVPPIDDDGGERLQRAVDALLAEEDSLDSVNDVVVHDVTDDEDDEEDGEVIFLTQQQAAPRAAPPPPALPLAPVPVYPLVPIPVRAVAPPVIEPQLPPPPPPRVEIREVEVVREVVRVEVQVRQERVPGLVCSICFDDTLEDENATPARPESPQPAAPAPTRARARNVPEPTGALTPAGAPRAENPWDPKFWTINCGHIYCEECINSILATNPKTCAVCRKRFTKKQTHRIYMTA